ncbi:MAG: hypothetical protein AB7E81_16140, partial [Hyphomicrobiaceae bacterium]
RHAHDDLACASVSIDVSSLDLGRPTLGRLFSCPDVHVNPRWGFAAFYFPAFLPCNSSMTIDLYSIFLRESALAAAFGIRPAALHNLCP